MGRTSVSVKAVINFMCFLLFRLCLADFLFVFVCLFLNYEDREEPGITTSTNHPIYEAEAGCVFSWETNMGPM